MPQQSTLERAFELARSGSYRSVEEIRRKLGSEGFDMVHQHTAGGVITQQLLDAMKATG